MYAFLDVARNAVRAKPKEKSLRVNSYGVKLKFGNGRFFGRLCFPILYFMGIQGRLFSWKEKKRKESLHSVILTVTQIQNSIRMTRSS